ncbi:cell death regulator Aven isoform X2 [Hyla sarda]|uniref:cell death regulator Aven isoform X2 n=1 Tax=Hyla sarda TaxID=327740 RepID=UPI0024C2D992|nr:cell death regulator Aven isoform X2 [Hyla sarda]
MDVLWFPQHPVIAPVRNIPIRRLQCPPESTCFPSPRWRLPPPEQVCTCAGQGAVGLLGYLAHDLPRDAVFIRPFCTQHRASSCAGNMPGSACHPPVRWLLGDSFTQFRFDDEKDWAAENLRNKQDSSVYLDSQSLVKALQNLPLHLRLNVEADLVQEELPQELPSAIGLGISNKPMVTVQKRIGASVASDQDSSSQPETQTPLSPSRSAQDEELDFLLSLDAPVEKAGTYSDGINQPNQQLTCEEHATSIVKAIPEEADEEKPKSITSEDLEDWLDSMIS